MTHKNSSGWLKNCHILYQISTSVIVKNILKMLGDQGNLYKVHRRSNSYDLAMSREASPVNHSTVRSPVPQYDRNSLVHKQIDDIGDDTYLIKWIEFNHSRVPILLQNRNGPCPLLAIANILLLRNRVKKQNFRFNQITCLKNYI